MCMRIQLFVAQHRNNNKRINTLHFFCISSCLACMFGVFISVVVGLENFVWMQVWVSEWELYTKQARLFGQSVHVRRCGQNALSLSLCPNVEFLYLKNKPQSVMLCFSEWRYTTIQSLGIATNCHYAIYCFVSECLFVLCLSFWVCVISVSTDHQNGYLNNRNRFVKTKPTVFRI